VQLWWAPLPGLLLLLLLLVPLPRDLGTGSGVFGAPWCVTSCMHSRHSMMMLMEHAQQIQHDNIG
jgi:hypothetical protein